MKLLLRPFRLLLSSMCCLPVLLLGLSAAHATSFHWKDISVGGLYSDPDNWVSATGTIVKGPPKAGDDAGFPPQTVQFKAGDASATADISVDSTVFDLASGGYNVSGAVTIRNNSILTVLGGDNTLAAGGIVFNLGDAIEIDAPAKLSTGSISSSAGPAKIYTEGGTVKVSGKTTAFIEVDGGSFSTGSVNSSGIKITQPNSEFAVAGDLTTSSISISGSGSVARAATALAPGEVSVDTSAALSIDGALKIGLAGDGSTLSTLTVKSGGFVSSGTAEVSGGNGPMIAVSGIGSTWLINDLLQTGTVADGSVNVDADLGGEVSAGSVDLSVASSSNSVFLFGDVGSSLTVTKGPLRVGVGGYAFLGLTDCTATISGSAPIQLGVGSGSDGNLGVHGTDAKFDDGDAAVQVGVAGHGAMSVGDGAAITVGTVNVSVQATSGTSDDPSTLNVNADGSKLTILGPLVIAKTGGVASVSTTDGGALVAQSLLLGVNGSLDVTGGKVLVGTGALPADGTLSVASGGVLSGQGRASGTSVVNTSVIGNVVIGAGGTFLPGGDPNVFSIQGNCDLSGGGAGGGETNIEVAGAGTAGTTYDQLVVSGNLTLGGTLNLALLSGYQPKVGDTLDIIKAGAIKGSFAQIAAPGLTLKPVVGAGKLSLSVTSVSSEAVPVITSAVKATGQVGAPFSYQIVATNSPAGFAATGLPAGLTLNTATGVISGTPTAAGTFSVGISATNVAGTGKATLALTVVAVQAGAPVITSAASAVGTVGQAFSYQVTATNSPMGFAASGVPAGLVFNASTGVLSGTPTAAGTFTVTLSATNAKGTGTAALTLAIQTATPTVTVVAAGDGMAVEGGEKGKVLVERTGDTGAPLTVLYKTKGTAKAGVDYKPLPGSVVIPAGASRVKIKIKPIDNDVHDGKTKAKIKLLPASDGSYVVGDPSLAKIRVIDND